MVSALEASFKVCPKCGRRWASRTELLSDPQIILLGYQPGANGFRSGIFLFLHLSCETSLALELPDLEAISRVPLLAESQCTHNIPIPPQVPCLARRDGLPFPAACVCECVSDILSRVRSWRKATMS